MAAKIQDGRQKTGNVIYHPGHIGDEQMRGQFRCFRGHWNRCWSGNVAEMTHFQDGGQNPRWRSENRKCHISAWNNLRLTTEGSIHVFSGSLKQMLVMACCLGNPLPRWRSKSKMPPENMKCHIFIHTPDPRCPISVRPSDLPSSNMYMNWVSSLTIGLCNGWHPNCVTLAQQDT